LIYLSFIPNLHNTRHLKFPLLRATIDHAHQNVMFWFPQT